MHDHTESVWGTAAQREVGGARPRRECVVHGRTESVWARPHRQCVVHGHTESVRARQHREEWAVHGRTESVRARPHKQCVVHVHSERVVHGRTVSVRCSATERVGGHGHTQVCGVHLQRRTATQRCTVGRRGVGSAEPHRGVQCTTTPRRATQSHTTSAGVCRGQPLRDCVVHGHTYSETRTRQIMSHIDHILISHQASS